MAEMVPNDRFGPVLGLEPRCLRARRENPEPATLAAEPEPELEPLLVWQPVVIGPSVDVVTPELRRCVLDAREQDRCLLPPSVILPIMFGLSAILWLTLGWIAEAVTHCMAPH